MILQENLTSVETSDNFQTTDFRIDSKYKNKVLWMLINQYRHKVRTPVQEIISNARDAQRENGNPDTPIKIQLPTKLESTFIVRDYGVGMSEERVKTIFTSFGASTKNADNTQTGGFGIGAKSPLAYTDQFNIKTYIDGTFWVYVIAKNDKSGISIHLLEKGNTDEVNGTEVQIPVKLYDARDFRDAANRCTMFWDVKPIFNDVDEQINLSDKGLKITKGLTIYDKHTDLGGNFNDDIVLTVDGIPYQVDYSLSNKVNALKNIKNKLKHGTVAVLELNTGDIELLQTRESLDESEYTLSQLAKIGFKAFNDVELYIASCLSAKDLQGRIKQYKSLYENFASIKNHVFELFEITDNSIYFNKNLNAYGYDFQGKRGTTTKPVKQTYTQHYNGRKGFNLNNKYLTNIFYDDIRGGESDNLKARRLRNYVNTTDANNVTVINKGHASNTEYVRTLRMLGARKLSSLPLPDKKARVAGTRSLKPKTNNITIHRYGQFGDKFTRELDTLKNDTKFIYGDFSKSYNMEKTEWYKFLKNRDYTFCKVSATVKKKIKDDVNFTHIDDYLNSLEVTEEMFKHHKGFLFSINRNHKKIADRVKFICENSTRIGDKVLTRMADIVNIGKDTNRLPRYVRDKIEESYDKRLKMSYSVLDRLIKRLDTNYVNLAFEDKYNNIVIRNRSEALYYINTTYRRLF